MIPARGLEGLCASILESAGTSPAQSSIVAASLVRAEARGQPSHGVSRLVTYIKRIQAGLIDATSVPTVVSEAGAVAVLDGNNGFGHAVGMRAMELCVQKAQTYGIGAVAVRNSTHFGIASPFAEAAAAQGCIGLATTNGPPWMVPTGSKTRVLGTNPIAVAVPGSPGSSFTLDMATSVAALGKIIALGEAGTPIPAGWALDEEGQPTTEATVAAQGSLLPVGGPKGFGLALVFEVLSAVLSGAAVGREAGSMYRTWDRPERLGHFFLALSIAAFGPEEVFDSRLTTLLGDLRKAVPIEPGSRIYAPGEIEAERERGSARTGILLTHSLRTALEQAAEAANFDLPDDLASPVDALNTGGST